MEVVRVILLTLLLTSASALAATPPVLDPAAVDRLADDPYWHRLLHYGRSHPLASKKSALDGPGFFFAQDGKHDPRAELVATVAAFYGDGKVGGLKQHPQCAFPERLRFLGEKLGLRPEPVPCPEYEQFMKKLDPQGASLVFSSAFASNPGSMFGHTFLKIHSSRRTDLLDHGISFAATVPPTENTLAYIVFGFFGGYVGQFSLSPYYAKVNEYVNAESRDLWEYALDLSPEQTRRMVSHLWELETNSWFDYYFIDENCSYQLLTVLEVARPDWDISGGYFFVVPAETVKRVAAVPGAVREIRYRPSLRRKMLQSRALLSDADRRVFSSVLSGELTASDVRSPDALSAAATYLQYQRQENDGKLAPWQQSVWQEVLARRSELQGVDAPVSGKVTAYQEPGDDHPEFGHRPTRLALGAGGGTVAFTELTLKAAYHELLNNDLGYLPHSEINFPSVTLRYQPDTLELRVHEIGGLGIISLFPLSDVEKRISWKVNAGYSSPKDFGCRWCHVIHVEGGAGASLDLYEDRAILYGMGLARAELGEVLGTGRRLGLGPQAGFLWNPVRPYKLHLSGSVQTDLFQSSRQRSWLRFDVGQSYSVARDWELRGEGFWITGAFPYRELKGSLNYHF
jgi:hypothetical protein